MEPIHISMSGVMLWEAEVVGWVARGLTNMETAFQLQISSRKVQKHLERMFRKLGVRSRSELVERAYLALVQKGKGR
ncbi:MAG: helix-turn-helix transcriptional regulator [Nitrospirota bacterium]